MMRFIALVFFSFFLILSIFSAVYGSEKKEFVRIEKIASARLLSKPATGALLVRIPANTMLEIYEKRRIRTGRLVQTWYRVNYKGKQGWISQYVTTGKIIIRDSQTDEVKTKPAPYSDKPELGKYDQASKETFKEWTLKNTSVKWLEYQGNGNISVRLDSSKYTTKSNVQKIAESLARAYRLQTGYQKPISIKVWAPNQKFIWAIGRLN